MEEKYAIRYHIIVLAEALGGLCIHIATEDLKQEPQSYQNASNSCNKKALRIGPKT